MASSTRAEPRGRAGLPDLLGGSDAIALDRTDAFTPRHETKRECLPQWLCHLHDDEHQDDDDQHADNGADNASVHCVPPSMSEWVRQSTRSSVAPMAECRDARSEDCRSGRVSRPGPRTPPALAGAVEVQGRRTFVHTLC